jgi:hypothetical protein
MGKPVFFPHKNDRQIEDVGMNGGTSVRKIGYSVV